MPHESSQPSPGSSSPRRAARTAPTSVHEDERTSTIEDEIARGANTIENESARGVAAVENESAIDVAAIERAPASGVAVVAEHEAIAVATIVIEDEVRVAAIARAARSDVWRSALTTTAPRRSFPLAPRRSIAIPAPRRRSASDDPWIGRALLTAGKLALLTFIAYGLMFNFSVVRGSSMSPGIHDGDRILVNHLSYLFQDVQRGDIVVLQYPLDPNLDYIKRVIGLPGDEIAIDASGVSVNGQRIDEPYVAAQDDHSRLVSRVEPEHFFVLGDNRPHSSDSREFGQVPRENLRGKVDLRIWPPSRAGTLR
jgi:signal peptidase I